MDLVICELAGKECGENGKHGCKHFTAHEDMGDLCMGMCKTIGKETKCVDAINSKENHE